MKYYKLNDSRGFQWWVNGNPYYTYAVYPETFKHNTYYESLTVGEMVKLRAGFSEVTEKEFKKFLKAKNNFIFNRNTGEALKKLDMNN